MANNLNIELKGKWVLLNKEYFNKEVNPLDNFFLCLSGFGTSPSTSGYAIFGHFQDGEEARIEGYDIERLATNEEELKLNVIENLKQDG
jgi:hypothetical protein